MLKQRDTGTRTRVRNHWGRAPVGEWLEQLLPLLPVGEACRRRVGGSCDGRVHQRVLHPHARLLPVRGAHLGEHLPLPRLPHVFGAGEEQPRRRHRGLVVLVVIAGLGAAEELPLTLVELLAQIGAPRCPDAVHHDAGGSVGVGHHGRTRVATEYEHVQLDNTARTWLLGRAILDQLLPEASLAGRGEHGLAGGSVVALFQARSERTQPAAQGGVRTGRRHRGCSTVCGPGEDGDEPPSLECLRGATGLTELWLWLWLC
mmetsp:Transcript_41591/g.115897  ORF Transcript_41591/g.115897 Transcript_41591/m.115897 type:complete len:259 (-) Transcript_41591:69-845(-)